MKYVEETEENKESFQNFAKEEWDKFNEEKGYEYKEDKFTRAAIEEGKVLGFIHFKINGGASYLSQLIVSKEARGKGVGKMLLGKFEKESKEKGCHLAYLETSEKHKGALKFYNKLGYEKIATLKKNKFGFNWYYMEKRL